MAGVVHWVLKRVGESPFWRVAGKAHTALYRATGGRIGFAAGHITNLLLTTTGRKSGASRTVPLAYMADGERYVIVASNGGSDRHPAWWLNLRMTPRATIQVREQTLTVVAHEADAGERARLWAALKAYNPFYAQYEQITERQIPVVVLEPAAR
jgi:deazaflavin-dependent oxidoreductase (nitroreductase family)